MTYYLLFAVAFNCEASRLYVGFLLSVAVIITFGIDTSNLPKIDTEDLDDVSPFFQQPKPFVSLSI